MRIKYVREPAREKLSFCLCSLFDIISHATFQKYDKLIKIHTSVMIHRRNNLDKAFQIFPSSAQAFM